jgi:Ca2+-binding EF-hand superfamily protein
MYIINLLATSDEKHELTKVFQQLDVNNNGKLCKAELL